MSLHKNPDMSLHENPEIIDDLRKQLEFISQQETNIDQLFLCVQSMNNDLVGIKVATNELKEYYDKASADNNFIKQQLERLDERINKLRKEKERESEIEDHVCSFVPVKNSSDLYEYVCSDDMCPYIRSPSVYSEASSAPESVESCSIASEEDDEAEH
jgi:DNA repair exonuclease SbcCD ATPase subunit